MQESRLFRIIYYLLQNKKMTAAELARIFEVSVRTIYRDIDALSLAGIPVYSVQGKGGGISLLENFTLDKGMFSDEEQQAIITALYSMGELVGESENPLFLKLSAMFMQEKQQWLSVDFSRWGSNASDTEKFEQIKNSILEKRLLEFNYYGEYTVKKSKRVKPIRLVYKSGSWYLQGYCTDKNDFRLYKVNRINDLKETEEFFGEEYEPPEMTESFSNEKLPLVQIYFSKDAAYRVFDEFSKESIFEEGEKLLVKCRMPIDRWLIGYLLSFGTAAEVLEPTSLREEFLDELEKLYQYYFEYKKF